jgi:predicted CXXCH cytochrome family protein
MTGRGQSYSGRGAPNAAKGIITSLVLASLFLALSSNIFGQTEPSPQPASEGVANEACLTCHSNPDLQLSFRSGESISLTVDPNVYNNSAHGRLGLYCTACHTDITGFPHPEVAANTHRQFSVLKLQMCFRCHEDNYLQTADSVHKLAMDRGTMDAAICVDCHGYHSIPAAPPSRSDIAKVCRNCHSEIYDLYLTSVHGSALADQNNPDVPTCTDCHGTHRIEGPSTEPFRLRSVQLCARCHTDSFMMSRYNLNTDVLNTYLSDFHGTTVVLFETTTPDRPTDKPVCIDCHGVHNIMGPNDPESTVIKENILATCRKCHPNASTNFPAAWLNHYEPSMQHYPLVYIVRLVYLILIPLIIGGMFIFVMTDYFRMVINRFRGRRHG